MTINTNNYQEAKRKFTELRDEERALANRLSAATDAGDTGEIDRLRQRQSALPGEKFEAELKLASANVARLRAEQVEAKHEHERAKLKSKETDLRVAIELKELDAKRKELSDERYAGLLYAHRLNESIQRRYVELDTAEQELRAKLERATTPIV